MTGKLFIPGQNNYVKIGEIKSKDQSSAMPVWCQDLVEKVGGNVHLS